MQDAGARRVSNAEGMRGIVRKHDCALPAQYTKHSNARGHSLGVFWVKAVARLWQGSQVRVRVRCHARLGLKEKLFIT